jgi:hypothetical protein
MRALLQHGIDLLSPIESVSLDGLKVDNVPEVISHRIIRTNFRELIVIYFELADDHSHNTVPYLDSLSDELFSDAVRAIRTIWGTNNQVRRSSISLSLYNYLQNRIPQIKLARTLQRYVEIGYLTFDKSNPGYTHPPRKEKSMDEFIRMAKQTLDEFDSRENTG